MTPEQGDPALKMLERLPRLCSPVHVCFPPRPTYCLICRGTEPSKCPYPEMQRTFS